MRWYSAPGCDDPKLQGARAFKGLKVNSSIAHLYQRPRVWVEAFHSSGWGTSAGGDRRRAARGLRLRRQCGEPARPVLLHPWRLVGMGTAGFPLPPAVLAPLRQRSTLPHPHVLAAVPRRPPLRCGHRLSDRRARRATRRSRVVRTGRPHRQRAISTGESASSAAGGDRVRPRQVSVRPRVRLRFRRLRRLAAADASEGELRVADRPATGC